MIDKSGSCAVILVLVDNIIYIANVGDSRCLLSMNDCKKFIEVTKDHKPNTPDEKKRIELFGGKIYQTETLIKKSNNPDIIGKKLVGPYRVSPGGLSVSRTIGDVEAKLEKFGDFFILGCDGIFDQLTSDEVINCAWMIYNNNNKENNTLINQCKDIHTQSGLITDLIMKSALARKSLDNVTCLFISFKEIGNFVSNENNNNNIVNNSNINNNNRNINVNRVNRAYTSYINNRTSLNSEIKNKENVNYVNAKKENKIEININKYCDNKTPATENKNSIRINTVNNKLSNEIPQKDNDNNDKNINNINNIKVSIRKKYQLIKNDKKNEINKISSTNVIKPYNNIEIKNNTNINTNNNNNNINNINTNINPIRPRRKHSYLSSSNINYK